MRHDPHTLTIERNGRVVAVLRLMDGEPMTRMVAQGTIFSWQMAGVIGYDEAYAAYRWLDTICPAYL